MRDNCLNASSLSYSTPVAPYMCCQVVIVPRPQEANILHNLQWQKVAGAAPHAIDVLRSIAPVDLPESYYSLLLFSNGGQGPLAVQPLWFCLYPAEEAAKTQLDGTFREFFEGLFVIGSSGGGEALAFDLRESEPYPVVAFDMANANLSESVTPLLRLSKPF